MSLVVDTVNILWQWVVDPHMVADPDGIACCKFFDLNQNRFFLWSIASIDSAQCRCDRTIHEHGIGVRRV